MSLKLEAQLPSGAWVEVGPRITSGGVPGSVSNNTPQGRDVILFFCEGELGYIYRSRGGTDVEGGRARVLVTEGFETLATLGPGESHQMEITTDRGRSYTLRWTNLG